MKEKGQENIYPRVTTWDVVEEYWKSMKKYWPAWTLVIFGVLIAVTASVITPIFYKDFFNLLTDISNSPNKDISALVPIIYTVLTLNLINWLGWRVSWFSTNYLEGHVMRDVFQRAFDYVIGHPHSFFISNFAGALVQKINRFARSFENIFEKVFYDIFILVLKIIGAGFILYFTQPKIAFAMGIWVLVFLSVSYFFSKKKLKYDIRAAETNSKMTGIISDSISNHNSIQLFSGAHEESKRVDLINTPFMKLNIFRWNFGSYLDAAQALFSLRVNTPKLASKC